MKKNKDIIIVVLAVLLSGFVVSNVKREYEMRAFQSELAEQKELEADKEKFDEGEFLEEDVVVEDNTVDKVVESTTSFGKQIKPAFTKLTRYALGFVDDVVNEFNNSNTKNVITTPTNWEADTIQELGLQDHREIVVDGGDTNPNREASVKVNVGFGDRDYWGFTNEHGQLVVVIAENVIVQDDSTEPVKSDGRYYSSLASVKGAESKEYDRGHVIADSLGGVSNAYNITPQQYVLNRHGDQAYMERGIRQAGGATQLVATIEYPNTETQTPTHYTFNYVIKGNRVTDSFANANPED